MQDSEMCIKTVFNPMYDRFEQIKSTHSFAWSGKMQCTGVYRCIFCGYTPKDKQRKFEHIGGIKDGK